MKNQILQYLSLTFVPNSATVNNATNQLSQMSKMPGFCMTMMEIADDQTQNIPIRQAALVQFKNLAKKRWNSTQNLISIQQKTAIYGALIPAFINSSSNHLLLKLYKQIITVIVGFSYKQWLPIQTLCAKLNANQNGISVMHCIIAITDNFEISIQEQQRSVFYKIIQTVLPVLYNFIQKNPSQIVIYLTMKFIWKIVHYQISNQVRQGLCAWMDFIITIAGASNSEMEAQIQEQQNRQSKHFYYFHAKKWATRIIHRFLSRHACATGSLTLTQQNKQINKQFAKFWFESFGEKVIDCITKQFLIPNIKKARYFQIKCLTSLVNNHPQSMKQFAQSFQYQLLLPYLQLQPNDEDTANSDPLQFINKEQDYNLDYTYLKKVATQAWTAFTNIGSKKKKGKFDQVGPLFHDNIKFIKTKLEGSNPLQKQMAMYLICQLRVSIINCDLIKSFLPGLIAQFVVPQFTSQIMFLRARSMQIFQEYGDLFTEQEVLKKSVQGIYFCLTQDNYPLVRLQAAGAFHVLLQHQKARNQVKPLFKQILQIYLILLQRYDSESLVMSLTGIVEHFSVQVGPYACQLVKYLSKHFIKLFNKDKAKADDPDYDGQTELAAAGVLGTMKILLQAPIDKQNIIKMQGDVLDVCDFVFFSDDIDYIQDVVGVLQAYTHRAPAMTERLLFYYVLLIYYVAGIDKIYWDKIPHLPLSDVNKKALDNIKSGCNIEGIDSITLVLRNYIALDTQCLFKNFDPFGINLLQLIFKMVDQIYQKGPDQFDGQIQMNSCSILMVYLLENNHRKWDDMMLNHIWQVVKFNLLKAKSKLLKCINAQLISVFMWNNIQKFILIAQNQNLLENALLCIINSEQKLTQQHERQRVILGLSELFAMSNKPQQVFVVLPKLFKLSVNLVKKNCDYRLNQQQQQNYLTESDEQDSQQQKFDFNIDQPQDIWEQDFENNYSSKLDQVDEIKYFKEHIQDLQQKQFNIYNQLMKTVPAQELQQLDSSMAKAIDLNVATN